MVRISPALVLALASQGCALQSGITAHQPGPLKLPLSSTTSVLVVAPGGQGPFAAAHTTIADPSEEGLVGFRSLIGAAGWRFMARGGGLELAAEGGGGEPAFVDYHGPGMYLGASLAGLVRIGGHQDVEPGFAPVGFLLDLVTTARCGYWTPPAGPIRLEGELEGSLGLALRVTVMSDLLDLSGEDFQR